MTWIGELGALITSVEQYTHDYLSRQILDKDYYRFQKIMDKPLELDSYSKDNIDQLIQYGIEIAKANEKELSELIQAIVDQWAEKNK